MSAIEQRARELLATQFVGTSGQFEALTLEYEGRVMVPAKEAIDAIIAALTPPEGFVLVPVEPTEGMLTAGFDADEACGHVPTPWDAMLAARPEEI